METKPYQKKHASPHLRNEVFPYVTAGKVRRLPPQVNLADRSWPFVGSFLLHALLVAMISCQAFHYPLLINSQTPTVFWFALSPPDGSEEAAPPLLGASVAFASPQETTGLEPRWQDAVAADDPVYRETIAETPADAEPELTVAAPLPAKKTVKAAKSYDPPPEPPPSRAPLPTPAPVKSVSVPLAPEPESPRALPAAPPTVATAAESHSSDGEQVPQNVDNQILRQVAEQNQQAAEKLRREQIVREQELRAAREKLAQERAVVEKARQERLAREKEIQKRKVLEDAMARKEMERAARVKAEKGLPAVAALQNKPAPQQLKKAPEPQSPVKPVEKPMSVSLPLIKGDLKLVIAGSIQPDTTITFMEFAQSRRGRPFSRAESRRFSKIIPLTADTRDAAREIVIARAGPGVYTITGVSANGPANVTLSLKLYEGTSRAVTRELGRHTITVKKILVKILMPDGILWDDNTAFSGNMEDSDGVTKFNTESGLMWKEYTE